MSDFVGVLQVVSVATLCFTCMGIVLLPCVEFSLRCGCLRSAQQQELLLVSSSELTLFKRGLAGGASENLNSIRQVLQNQQNLDLKF